MPFAVEGKFKDDIFQKPFGYFMKGTRLGSMKSEVCNTLVVIDPSSSERRHVVASQRQCFDKNT